MSIRSSSQDDTDGTSSIVLPCPGSQIMFHFFPYVNIVLNILLCSPFFIRNNNIYCTIQAHLYFYITTLNVPFSDIFVPKHFFKACKNTIYCLIQSTLYFKKNIFYCPVIKFMSLIRHFMSHFSDIIVPIFHILKACNSTIYCPIQSILYVQKNVLYCFMTTPYIVRFQQLVYCPISDNIVPKFTPQAC